MAINWTNCPDVERTPGTLSGAWRVKGTRIPVQAILDNAEDCTPEEIARDIFEGVTVEQVRRILCFAAESRARERAMTEGHDLPYFSGEDELSALLLAMVIDHCGSCSPEKRRTMTSFFSPDPSPGEWLDSYGSPANADAMLALEEQGLIEIAEIDGARIVAKVTAEGRELLDHLRAEQERNAAVSWQRRQYTAEELAERRRE